MPKHIYTHIQCLKQERGTAFQLRRDDGKKVIVSRKRFNELTDQKRLVSREQFKKVQAEKELEDYCNFMDQVIES